MFRENLLGFDPEQSKKDYQQETQQHKQEENMQQQQPQEAMVACQYASSTLSFSSYGLKLDLYQYNTVYTWDCVGQHVVYGSTPLALKGSIPHGTYTFFML